MKFELSPRVAKLLEHIHDKGFVTKSTRPFLTTLRYYNYLWHLRDCKLIICDGMNKNSHQKRWVLTEKGNLVAENIKEIRRVTNEGESNSVKH